MYPHFVNYAALIINNVFTSSINQISNKVFGDRIANYNDIKVFGTEVMVLIPKAKRKALDKNAEKMYFVGLDFHQKGVRCVEI